MCGLRTSGSSIGLASVHALSWLVLANGVGLLMAILLLWPQIGHLLGPVTYGRLVPLHLNCHLYGWLSLPLIAMLFHLFQTGNARLARLAVWCWSVSLAVGGLSWLAGQSSGKLFLDWKGFARVAFVIAMCVLWLALVRQYWAKRACWNRPHKLGRLCLLMLLLPVPLMMYLASGAGLYPPINPNSGGATGSSLLGSTLAIITLFLAAPHLICKTASLTSAGGRLICLLLLHWLGFGLLDHGNVSNHQTAQIVGLASLIPWVGLLFWYYRRFLWPRGTLMWLLGFAFWATLLVVSGWLSFLPDVLARYKFTNGLVAHAHLAMAGMVTSFLMVVILAINGQLVALARRLPCWLWQFSCLVHIVVLALLGALEGHQHAAVFLANSGAGLLLGMRLLAGLVMLVVSAYWLLCCRSKFYGEVS